MIRKIAHLTAMSLVESGDDDPENLPSTVGEALEQSLLRIAKALQKVGPGDRERTVPGWRLWIRELLTPLGYTEGEGPDDELWASLATMMGTDSYSVQDVRLLRDRSPAGDLLQGGAAATRLFHSALAEHLREDASQPDLDREISELLISRVGSGVVGGTVDWDAAPAYTRHYLASHAGRAGVLDVLMLDVGYLLVADPVRLLAQLPSLTNPKAQQVAHVYQLTAHRLRGVNRQSAASALGLTALLSEVRWFADAIAAVITMTAEPLWAHWQPVSPHRQLVGHQAPVMSVAVCEIGDSLLVVSGAENGKVLAWDYATTLEAEVPDDSLPGPVTAVAAGEEMLVAGFQVGAATQFRDLRTRHAVGGEQAPQASVGIVNGRPIVAAGDNQIELRNLDTGSHFGGPFDHSEAPVTALGFGRTKSADVLMAACTEAKVHLWQIASQTIAGVLATRQDPITATAVHEVDGYLTIVAVHSNRRVQSWDVATGRPVGLPFVGHTGRVLAVAAGEFRGRPYVVTGGEDGTVRVWETGDATHESVAEQKGMLAVAVGRHDGATVVVTADQTRVLQTWSLSTGDEAGPPVKTTGGAPATLALGLFGGYDSIAGVADEVGRIHLWDLATAQRVPQRSAGNGWSSVLTVGTMDGRLVSATGGVEPRRTVVVYDLHTSDQVGTAITLSSAATNAFVGRIGDRRLLATADRSNAVAVWDLDTGRPYGRSFPPSGTAINAVALGNLRTGPVIATAGPSAPVQVWHLTRDERITLDLGSTITGLAFSDDDTLIVTADAGIACVRICGQHS
jgi:WD40 repeat protein